jgi:DNA polymerase-1
MGAIAANDSLLAATFNNAEFLKNNFMLTPTTEAFEKWKFEGDAHRANASAAYGVPIRQVTGDQRQAAKNVSFLCVYSANPAPQLAVKINSSVDEAQKVVDGFLGKFVDLQAYLKSRDVIAEAFGFIHTPLGRTRSLYAAMFPGNKKQYSHAINQARNTGIQSSASDLLLLALYKFICYIEDNCLPWRIVNVVHDSVLGLVPIGDEKEFGRMLKHFMENPGLEEFGFDPKFCAMTADTEIGRSYSGQVSWDGTDAHYTRIEKWLNAGAPDDEPEPESRFSEYLSAMGKFEKQQSKIEKAGAAATDDDRADLAKLQEKLDAIKAIIAEEYAPIDKPEPALA